MKLTSLISALFVVIAIALAGGCSTTNPDSGATPSKSSGGGGY